MILNSMSSNRRVVIVPGIFDICTANDLAFLQNVKQFAGRDGIVIAIVFNQTQVVKTNGYQFMPLADRMAVVGQLKHVNIAVASQDDAPFSFVNTLTTIYKHRMFPIPTHVIIPPGFIRPIPEELAIATYGGSIVYDFAEHIPDANWDINTSIEKAYHREATKNAA